MPDVFQKEVNIRSSFLLHNKEEKVSTAVRLSLGQVDFEPEDEGNIVPLKIQCLHCDLKCCSL